MQTRGVAVGGDTHAESGASLSLFSRRYLTSEIRRQPALLNSEWLPLSEIFVHGYALRTWA